MLAALPHFKELAIRRRGFLRMEYQEDVWIQMSENLSNR
jgi:hypothetical protein